MTTATQALREQIDLSATYTKNKLATITGLTYTRVKNLLIASGYNLEQKEYSGQEILNNFVRAVEYQEAGKSLEDIKIMLNVATNGSFVPEEAIYTPEEKAKIDGKREQIIDGIAEQLADDVFEILAGADESNPDDLAASIAGKAKTALDRRFADLRSQSKRLFINLL